MCLSKKHERAFTLLEVLIALALIAILMIAAVPYMSEAWQNSKADQIAQSIKDLAIETRAHAIVSGEMRFISIGDPHLVPKGWRLEIQRFTDQKFRPPLPDELWQFNSEGICDPLTLRLLGGKEPLTLKFDPITGQVTQDEE